MDVLFFALFIISFLALIVGLIKPKAVILWGNPSEKNRKNVFKYYGIGLILSFVLFGVSVGDVDATNYDHTDRASISENADDIIDENTEIKDNIAEPSNEGNEPNNTHNGTSEDAENAVAGNLEVHFIDVGQADSILIKTGSNSMLIDAGNNADAELVVNYIKSQGIKYLDYVIGTHPHEDHIGGLDAVINSFDIGKVLMPKQTHTSQTFKDVLTAIQNKNLKVTSPSVGDKYKLGEAEWTIYAPSKQENEEMNNSSIAIRLEFGNNSFMFTGDAEEVSEMEMLKLGGLKSDVLKVGHHGSSSSTSPAFLNEVNPTYAVISVGVDNSYGHPHKEVVERLNSKNIEILRTDELGTIIFISDGNNLKYETTTKPATEPANPNVSKPEVVEPTVGNDVNVKITKLDKKAELITITNKSNKAVDMTGWKIVSVTGNQTFIFPQFSLNAGSSVTVGGYDSLDISDFDWEDGRGVWNNSESDPAELYDASGNLIDTFYD